MFTPILKKSVLKSLNSLQRIYFLQTNSILDLIPTCDRISTANIHTNSILLKRRKDLEEKKSPNLKQYSPKPKSEVVDVWHNITVKELSEVMGKKVSFIEDLFLNTVRGGSTVIADQKELQAAIRRSGKRMRTIAKPNDKPLEAKEESDAVRRPPPEQAVLKKRPPVVTVMGHVDHGKTTLLDALRKSNVVEQEFGGITQHIGAFSVLLPSGGRVTFLDTPGHAAFASMRERGANITDIVVLVVAADDGVMEQTVESIRMARQANVPILVAINKIDAPKADIERTQRMLVEYGIQVESVGGDVQAIPVSALKRQNLDQLVEAIILQAELKQIKADPTGLVEAVVVESKVDRHRGKLCTAIVQRGTMKKGNVLVAGTAMAKVRSLKDADGKVISEVAPGYPTEIEGWRDLPNAGEVILEVESEKRARAVVKIREEKSVKEKEVEVVQAIEIKEKEHLLKYKENLKLRRSLGRFKLRPDGPRKPEYEKDDSPQLNVILKCDVDGTLEAILNALITYQSKECPLEIINYGVGSVTENDIELAETFKAVIYAFNVKSQENILDAIKKAKVSFKQHNIIYKLIDDVKEEINARLPLVEVEEIVGEAMVVQQFDINEGRRKVPVAGCRCTKGVLKRNLLYRLKRGDEVVHDGTLSSMRHLKNEVDSIKKGLECGLQLADKEIQFQQDDVLICYEKKMQPQVTDWNPGF